MDETTNDGAADEDNTVAEDDALDDTFWVGGFLWVDFYQYSCRR